MTEKQKNNLWNNEALKKETHEPAVQAEEPVQSGDPFIEEELEEEAKDIEKLEEKLDSKQQDPQELQKEIARLKEELNESHDKLLRAHAEMENIRSRAKTDVEKAHKYGLEKIIKELLPVIDSLEKTLETTQDHPVISDGVSLTLQLLLRGLNKFGVKILDPHGEPFNPLLHEAMSTQENKEVDSNTVLQVLQKGYQLNERLIRPALVIVSK